MNQDDQGEQPAASVAGAAAKRWKLAIAAVLIVAVFAFALLKLLGPVPVVAVHPQRGPLVAEVFGTGTLEAKVVVSFSAKMVDKVVEVLVDQGDTVTDGQVLARLEATDYEHSVRVAEAGVGQAQAELAKARLDIARKRELLQTASISQAEFDTYEAAYRVGEAKLKNAEAQLGFARARLADTVIYSPVAGLVMTRNLEVGDTVVPGTPIFRIADTRLLWITAMVDERVAGNLRVGQPARVTFRAHPGQSFPRAPRPAGGRSRPRDRGAGSGRDGGAVAAGLVHRREGGRVHRDGPRGRRIAGPKSAVAPRDDRPGVFVVTGGHARWQFDRFELIGRDTVELAGGVDARDLVITDPFAGSNRSRTASALPQLRRQGRRDEPRRPSPAPALGPIHCVLHWVGMLLTLVLSFAGIYNGFVADALALIDSSGADLWVVQTDTRGPFAELSRLPDDVRYRIAIVPGSARRVPTSSTPFSARGGAGCCGSSWFATISARVGRPDPARRGPRHCPGTLRMVADRRTGPARGRLGSLRTARLHRGRLEPRHGRLRR